MRKHIALMTGFFLASSLSALQPVDPELSTLERQLRGCKRNIENIEFTLIHIEKKKAEFEKTYTYLVENNFMSDSVHKELARLNLMYNDLSQQHTQLINEKTKLEQQIVMRQGALRMAARPQPQEQKRDVGGGYEVHWDSDEQPGLGKGEIWL